MASRIVTRKSLCLINSTLENSGSVSKTSLSSTANQVLVQSSSKVPDASVIRPTAKCRPPVLPCPPPRHVCPPPEESSHTSPLLRALWFLAKLGLFLGITQMTIDEGLWGSGEDTEDLAKRMGLISEDDGEDKPKDGGKEVCF